MRRRTQGDRSLASGRTLPLVCSVCCCTAFLLATGAARAGRGDVVEVGVFDFKPLVIVSTPDAAPQGIFIDVLSHIAAIERWDVHYVFAAGGLPKCLELLEAGKIDLAPAIASAPGHQETKFEYSSETIFSTWGQIYSRKDRRVQSLLDLRGKVVAIVKGDVYGDETRKTAERLGIVPEFIEVNDYETAVRAITKEWVDAAVVDRLYGALHAHEFEIDDTRIILSPVELRFASPKDRGRRLLAPIDFQLAKMKREQPSVLSAAESRWLGHGSSRDWVPPAWLKWALGVGAALLALLAGFSAVLRHEVRRKTIDLATREQELRESKQSLETIIQTAPSQIMLTDAQGNVLLFNAACERASGHRSAEVLGKNAIDLLVPAERYHEAKEQFERGSDPMSVEAHLPHLLPWRMKNGNERLIEWRCTQLKLPGDNGSRILNVGQDITERRKLETQLAQADRLSSMGMLAAGIAHEINNPLCYVLFNLESLCADVPKILKLVSTLPRMRASSREQDAAVEMSGHDGGLLTPRAVDDVLDRLSEAYSGVLRIKSLTRSLGTFSRVERTEMTPVKIQNSIEHAINMAFNELKYRTRIVKDFSPTPAVVASEGKLAQVFLNLLINAAHAIDEGHVDQNEVRVHTWADGDWVCAEVGDTGRGIALEHRARIFEPFFTTKGVGVGSGLGLSICKNIIQECGGEITFTSEVGKGTQFLIRLPRMAREWDTRGESERAPASARSSVQGRVLVVDDEDGVRSGILRVLRNDHEVITASSGEEGQAILERDRGFDLIFCDLMMPKQSGMDLHSWLAERDTKLAEQVVFITGGSFTPKASEYLAKVGNLRVEKPFDSRAFKKMTDELVLAARAKRKRDADSPPA